MFKRIYIEISNICNLQCTFCPVVDRDKQVLNPDNFKNILSQAKPLTEEVCLHLMGEPVAHPEFGNILKVCDDYNTPVQLTTNGVVLENKKHYLLNSSSIRQINFSIQAWRDNFPDKDFQSYLQPILKFTKELHEVRPEVYINFRLWNLGRNVQINKDNEEVFKTLESFYDVKINRNVQVEAIKSKRIWERVYLHFDSHFDWPNFHLPHQGMTGRCHALSGHFGIHADGTVVPCCLDKEAQIPLGNCLEDDLVSILNSDRAMAIKRGFQNNQRVEELCQHCTYINRFG